MRPPVLLLGRAATAYVCDPAPVRAVAAAAFLDVGAERGRDARPPARVLAAGAPTARLLRVRIRLLRGRRHHDGWERRDFGHGRGGRG